MSSSPLKLYAQKLFAIRRRLGYSTAQVLRHPLPVLEDDPCGQPNHPVFRGSSVVEHPTVNRTVVGSSPTRGANLISVLSNPSLSNLTADQALACSPTGCSSTFTPDAIALELTCVFMFGAPTSWHRILAGPWVRMSWRRAKRPIKLNRKIDNRSRSVASGRGCGSNFTDFKD